MTSAVQMSTDWFPDIAAFNQSSQIAIPITDVLSNSLRLDAGLYASEGYQIRHAFEQSKFNSISLLDTCSKIYEPSAFKRTFTAEEFGIPFVTSSELMEAKPNLTRRYISKDTKNLNLCLIKRNEILITAAGTIGNIAIATSDLEGIAVTSDVMHLQPYEDFLGTIYAALLSSFGQFLLKQFQYGSVIQHVKSHQISQIKIPLFPMKLREELTALIRKTCHLRVKANDILKESEQELKETVKLPELSELRIDNLLENGGEATTFSCSSAQRLAMNGQFGTLRLDATYHEPTACALAKYILSRRDGKTLDQVLLKVRNSTLRKRIYVDEEEQGVPLIGGKQLIQLRPAEIKYLSKILTRNILNETVEKGWTLVSCGGTLGRIQFVHRNHEGWAASQHVMRLIPNMEEVFPGYLFSFLSSPYGQIQVQQRSYGSVIPEIRDFQFNSIAICIPDDRGESIHNKVIKAFDARADARIAEDSAVELFMNAIRNGKEATESMWGGVY